jgi:hypothetical protein
MWLWAAAAHVLLAILMVFAVGLSGREVDPVALACLAIIPAFYWVVYGVRFRVSVSAGGLEWMTLDGARWSARWDEIRGATRHHWLGLGQVQFELANGRGASWVPLNLSDPGGFLDALREYAGPDHPLTRAVEGR